MQRKLIAVLSGVLVGALAPAAQAAATWSNNITGSGSSALSSPEGVAMDGSNIVVSDANNHRLEVFSPDGTLQSFTSPVTLTEPRQAVLVGNDFIVSDHGANNLEKINATTGADDGAFGSGWSGNTEVATNHDQSLIAVANSYSQAVDVLTASGTLVRALSTTPSTTATALSYPEGVGFDASDNVWVGDTQNHRIVEFSGADGSVLRSWGYTESTGSFYPTGVSVDQRSGDVWVADWQHGQAIEFDPSGNVLDTVSTAGAANPLEGPLTVALDPATGDLYVAAEYGNEIVRYTGAGSTGAPPPPQTQAPSVTTTAADGISGTGATLHGTVNPNGGTITECKFLWGTDVNYRSTPVPCQESVGSGTSPVTVSAQISGLTAGQTYHFALLAKNAGGSTGGNDEQFVAGDPPGAATSNASSIDAHDLVINGTVSATGGLDTHYYFQWGLDLDHMSNNTPDTDVGTSPAGASAVLHGLQPFTQYCFRIVAYNARGTTYGHDAGSGDPGTNRGKCVSTNGGPIPTVTTSTPQDADIGFDHIDLHGSVETPSGTSSTAYFQISTAPDESGATTIPVTSPTSASPLPWADDAPHIVGATATGLKQGTTYYWRLVGSSLGGQNYGGIVQAITLSNTCHEQVKFGPITVIAGPVNVSGGNVSIGHGCMQQKGLTWVSKDTLTVAGLHITPDDRSTQVVIDPLNFMIRSTGPVKVTIGPWFALGHQIGPITLLHQTITFGFQAPPKEQVAELLFAQLARLGGALYPQIVNAKLPPTIVKLPDLSSKLPRLPNLPLPDFSKVADLTQLAKLAGINPGTIATDLNKPTVTFPTGLIPDVNLPTSCVGTTDASLGGLPFDGGACLTIKDNLTTIEAQALLPTVFSRADLVFGQVGLDAAVHIELAPSGQVTKLAGHADIPEFTLGPLTMDDSTIDYNGDNDEWTGHGGGGLFDNAIGVRANFDVIHGQLQNGTLVLNTPDYPVGATGLFLDGVGVRYTTVPTQSIGGTALFGYGPLIPFPKGSGHVFKVAVSPLYDFGNRVLHLVGDLYVLTDPAHGSYTELSAPNRSTFHIDWSAATGQIAAGASLGFSKQADLGWPLGKSSVSVSAGVGGSFVPGSPPQFQVDGTGSIQLTSNVFSAGINAALTVSSKGFAACAQGSFGGFDGEAGVGYTWGGGWATWLNKGICNLGPYQAMAPLAARDVAHTAAADSFVVSPGQRQVNLTFSGDAGAPQVILRGPGGAVVQTPTAGTVAATHGTLALVDATDRWSAIDLYRPAPGRWTITLAPGSPAITQAARADSLPSPSIQAHVVRRGHRYALVYRMARIAGQQVTFSEQGRGASRVIGSTGAASGTLVFTPAYGPGGLRRIVAQVDQDGLPRTRLSVASYSAPRPVAPARPAALRIVRSGSRAMITWRRVANAARYLIAVTYNVGIRTVRAVTSSRLVLAPVFSNRPVTAAVVAADSHGLAGRPARARSAGSMPPLRSPRKKHRH